MRSILESPLRIAIVGALARKSMTVNELALAVEDESRGARDKVRITLGRLLGQGFVEVVGTAGDADAWGLTESGRAAVAKLSSLLEGPSA